MKIVINETQLNELKVSSERYLDQLLDKISKNGIESLSQDEKEDMNKMSKNVDVLNPDTPLNTESILALFKNLFPLRFKIDVDGETWLVNLKTEEYRDVYYLIIDNPEQKISFALFPFLQEKPVFTLLFEDMDDPFDIPIGEDIPKTKKEVENFYKNFMSTGLRDIIKKYTFYHRKK